MELIEDELGLAIADGAQVLRADFSRMLPRIRQGRLQRELVVRASRLRGAHEPARAVDATAGLGEDALLLAAAGFSVTLFERDATIAALLRDGLRRARDIPELEPIVSRMELVEADSIVAMPGMSPSPDVVYLDPMFPARRKRAATKKKLQIIQQLESPCEDEELLLRAALEAHPRKIVVKRPLKGPYLGGLKPSHSFAGKVVRYDCIVPAAMG